MDHIIRIGMDTSKHVFQLHGVNAAEEPVLRSETPTADDLVRIDRNRKGKKLSNDEWTSKTDPEAKIA
jgi:hypothetical protein